MTNTIKDLPALTHTPGPWDYDMDYIVAPDPNGLYPNIYIAEIAHEDEEGRVASCEQQDGNRRLITAAPELFDAADAPDVDLAHDALSEALEDPDADYYEVRDAAVDLCRVLDRHHEARKAAIVKAEGRLP